MSSEDRKRGAPDGETSSSPRKRARVEPSPPVIDDQPRPEGAAQQGLQRAIALALKHVGFSAADGVAMVSFQAAVARYMDSIIEDLKRASLTARRNQPNPTDFESTLGRYNLPISSLKPLTRPIVEPALLKPKTTLVDTADPDFLRPLPTLGDELDGKPEKEKREFVPASFPPFPSKHTFISTPREEDEGRRDPDKVREEAAKAAKQGEDALRDLLRAAKIPQQKEIRSQVERHPASRERHRLWEKAMGRLMQTNERAAEARGHEDTQSIIANASMLVNSEAQFHRKEVPRTGRRVATNGGGQDGATQ